MADAQPTVRYHNPPALPTPVGYSQVAETSGGRTVYVSGQVALDSTGQLVGAGDFAIQTRQCFANVRAALEHVGLGFGDVVKLGIYVTDVARLAELRAVRDEFVDPARPPASTLVQVAALFRPDILVEVEATAVGPNEAIGSRG